jgi:hypothetical protein
MDEFGRIPGWTIPVSGTLTWGQKNIPKLSLAMDILMGFILGPFLIFYIGEGVPGIQIGGVLLMILMPAGGALAYLLLTSVFQRSQYPVLLHREGVEFHPFGFDRLVRKKSFLPVSDISVVKVSWNRANDSSFSAWNARTINFVTTKNSVYTCGERSSRDIEQAIKYIRKQWPDARFIDETGIISDQDSAPEIVRPTGTSTKARKIKSPPGR